MTDLTKIKLNVQQPQKQPFIMLCVPGREFSKHFLKSYTDLIGFFYEKNIRFAVSFHYSPVVYYVRNLCLGGDNMRGIHQKPYDGKIDYTHIMWIDSDMVFEGSQFAKLFNHNLDIVSGLYLMQGGYEFATVVKQDQKYFKRHGAYQFLKPEDIKGKTDLFEVDYTGFGFLLMKRHVIESLEYPWFRPIYHQIGPCYDFASEDASICQMIREKGFKIYVDPTIKTGHVKETIL